MNGLRLSMDYSASDREDAIFALTPQEAVNLEADFPGTVGRGAPDGHPSGAGPIQFIDFRYRNLPGGGRARVQVWGK